MSLRGIGVISVIMYSDRYDSFVPNVTDDYIWFERTQSSGREMSARCLDRCWAIVVVNGPALVRRWVGVPCLLGGIHYVLVQCWSIVFGAFYYLHFGVTYKPKWAGYYIVNIFILSLWIICTCHHNKNIQYNTIQYIFVFNIVYLNYIFDIFKS